MSIRRTIEANYQTRLQKEFEGSKYKVVGGVERDERPSPVIIVTGGEAMPAFSELADSFGNYNCEVSILVMSSMDKETVDEHNDAVSKVMKCMSSRDARKISVIQGLYIYDLVKVNVAEANDNEMRKVGTVVNFRAVFNYNE
jgi:hypothetical protein